jgi:hypothetical protein
LVSSDFTVSQAKKADPSLFSQVESLDWKNLSIKDINLAKEKAKKDVNDFYNNPSGVTATNFKKNLSPERYDLYKNLVSSYESHVEALKADDTLSKETS